MKIRQSGDFDRMYEALITTHPELAEIVLKQVERFVKNSNDTRLDNHGLHKSMEGKWAFSVNDDFRIIYEWLGKTTVRFLAIGHHSQVYRS